MEDDSYLIEGTGYNSNQKNTENSDKKENNLEDSVKEEKNKPKFPYSGDNFSAIEDAFNL